jgi:hypothetical protein
MHVILLGTAAGGGFPQWNCWCPTCRVARDDPQRARPRTQSSIAFSADGVRWFLGNASPDVREQLAHLPHPPVTGVRHVPVEGVVVIDDQTCIVEFALRTISFYQHESCGWCIPCREGTDWLKKSLTRFHAGFGTAKDIDNIRYLAENMLGRTFCPLGDAAAMPTLGFVKKFRKEFEDHLDGKPCPFAKHTAPELTVV